MKNIFLPKVTMCIIALLALILSASAQNTNATDEYKETLKKIMDFSGTSTTTGDFLQRLSSIMKLNAPKKDEAYWNEFSKNWKEKVENKVFEIKTVNNSRENKYIQSVQLNGRPYDKSYISHADIVNGGTLVITMGNKPNKDFGANMDCRPKSAIK